MMIKYIQMEFWTLIECGDPKSIFNWNYGLWRSKSLWRKKWPRKIQFCISSLGPDSVWSIPHNIGECPQQWTNIDDPPKNQQLRKLWLSQSQGDVRSILKPCKNRLKRDQGNENRNKVGNTANDTSTLICFCVFHKTMLVPNFGKSLQSFVRWTSDEHITNQNRVGQFLLHVAIIISLDIREAVKNVLADFVR